MIGGIIKFMRNMITPVSQSIDPEPSQVDCLKAEIEDLKSELKNVNTVLKYLATANVELARDMQIIYDSLRQISSSVCDPYDSMGFPVVDPDDDDMLN
tara:strand:- start:3057 stop:3350 length:294 start_codon:yes stop_codon:yes gene_type:complete